MKCICILYAFLIIFVFTISLIFVSEGVTVNKIEN